MFRVMLALCAVLIFGSCAQVGDVFVPHVKETTYAKDLSTAVRLSSHKEIDSDYLNLDLMLQKNNERIKELNNLIDIKKGNKKAVVEIAIDILLSQVSSVIKKEQKKSTQVFNTEISGVLTYHDKIEGYTVDKETPNGKDGSLYVHLWQYPKDKKAEKKLKEINKKIGLLRLKVEKLISEIKPSKKEDLKEKLKNTEVEYLQDLIKNATAINNEILILKDATKDTCFINTARYKINLLGHDNKYARVYLESLKFKKTEAKVFGMGNWYYNPFHLIVGSGLAVYSLFEKDFHTVKVESKMSFELLHKGKSITVSPSDFSLKLNPLKRDDDCYLKGAIEPYMYKKSNYFVFPYLKDEEKMAFNFSFQFSQSNETHSDLLEKAKEAFDDKKGDLKKDVTGFITGEEDDS